MEYNAFFAQRRERMALDVKTAYAQLAGNTVEDAKVLDVTSLVAIGESDEIEFKSTLRVSLHTREKDSMID